MDGKESQIVEVEVYDQRNRTNYMYNQDNHDRNYDNVLKNHNDCCGHDPQNYSSLNGQNFLQNYSNDLQTPIDDHYFKHLNNDPKHHPQNHLSCDCSLNSNLACRFDSDDYWTLGSSICKLNTLSLKKNDRKLKMDRRFVNARYGKNDIWSNEASFTIERSKTNTLLRQKYFYEQSMNPYFETRNNSILETEV